MVYSSCLLQESRGARLGNPKKTEMLSDFKNLDIMLGSDRFEREGSELGNSTRRPESTSYDALVDHNTNSHFF